MTKTKIEKLSRTKEIYYGEELYENFWLKLENSPDKRKNDHLKKIINLLESTRESVICLQVEKLAHPKITKAIYDASKRKNRIYIITNEKDNDLRHLEGTCLIRYGMKNIGSFLLINPRETTKQGLLITSPLLESSLASTEHISLELDEKQISILFRFFSDNFWNKTEFEIIKDFNLPQKTSEPPLDFYPNVRDFCDSSFVKRQISQVQQQAIISIPKIREHALFEMDFHKLQEATILTSLSNNDRELLKALKSKNNQIYSIEQNNLQFILLEKKGWLIPKVYLSEKDHFFALELNEYQVELLKDRLEIKQFEFITSKKREELVNQVIKFLDRLHDDIEVKRLTSIDLKQLNSSRFLPKEEFEKQEPAFEDDGISVEISYRWEIVPFYTPEKAKKANLYQQWTALQTEYLNFLKNIERIIEESKGKTIGEKLKRWFLGKKQIFKKQEKQLSQLKEKNLSELDKAERKKLLEEINELANRVSQDLSEIDLQIQRNKIEENIESLNEKLQALQKEYEILEQAEQSLSEDFQKLEKRRQERKKEKEEKFEIFCNKYKEKYKIGFCSKEINKLKLSDLKISKKKNKEKDRSEFSEELFQELEELKKLFQEGELGSQQKKLYNKKRENSRKRKDLDRQKEKLERQLKEKEKQLEELGKTKESKESSLDFAFGKKNPSQKRKATQEFSIPEDLEYLPKIGQLFELNSKKYLEIEYWEDYDEGLSEAKRLNAQLTAKKN